MDKLFRNTDWRSDLKNCIIATAIFGILAHAYCYFGGVFSHDSMSTLVSSTDHGWQISLGRFLQPFYWNL